jgi:heavy metal sensor kinase
MGLTIRWRLTLWNTLALAVALFGMAGLVHVLLLRTQQRIDQALQERLTAAAQRLDQLLLAEVRHLQPDELASKNAVAYLEHWIGEFREHHNLSCVVYEPSGNVFRRTSEMAAASVPPAPGLPPPEGNFADATLPVLGRQRTLAWRLKLGGRELTLLLLASLEEVDRERASVEKERAEVGVEFQQARTLLLASLPAALVLAGGLGYVLARKSLAPVHQLRRLTEAITADRLDRRLPGAHTRDELGRLAQTINAMIGRLERSFAEVRRFTADASHELRTPLTVLRAETEAALARPLSAAEYQQVLASILEECDRLTRLTEQLLMLAREEAGSAKPSTAAVDLNAVITHAVEMMRPLAEAHGLRLDLKSGRPVTVAGNETRLRQVLLNLLDNAIKYTPQGGSVTVDVTPSDHQAVVTVSDSGIGIASEHQALVFDRFYRVDKARTRAEGGTGLGLSIVRSIVVSHGGTVAVASAPGQGSTFRVVLPLQHSAS